MVKRIKKSSSLISIIIRTYNEEKHIGKLMEGIFDQNTKNEFEIIIVDSGSTDRTLEIAYRYPIKLVRIDSIDFSFGYSLNRGIEKSKGDYLIFISAHCYPENSDWLDQIVKPFSDHAVGLVYGRQRGNHLTKFSEQQIFLKFFTDKPCSRQMTPFCNNANAAVRRMLWEDLPYDEILTGLEDMDWAKKIIEKGYCISYNPKASIVHIHEEKFEKILRRYEREAIALKKIFPETYFNFIDFVKLYFLNLLSDYLHALKSKKIFKVFWEIASFRFAQFWGTYKGYNYNKPITDKIKKHFYYPRPVKKNHN